MTEEKPPWWKQPIWWVVLFILFVLIVLLIVLASGSDSDDDAGSVVTETTVAVTEPAVVDTPVPTDPPPPTDPPATEAPTTTAAPETTTTTVAPETTAPPVSLPEGPLDLFDSFLPVIEFDPANAPQNPNGEVALPPDPYIAPYRISVITLGDFPLTFAVGEGTTAVGEGGDLILPTQQLSLQNGSLITADDFEGSPADDVDYQTVVYATDSTQVAPHSDTTDDGFTRLTDVSRMWILDHTNLTLQSLDPINGFASIPTGAVGLIGEDRVSIHIPTTEYADAPALFFSQFGRQRGEGDPVRFPAAYSLAEDPLDTTIMQDLSSFGFEDIFLEPNDDEFEDTLSQLNFVVS